jgi:hypothetical protein
MSALHGITYRSARGVVRLTIDGKKDWTAVADFIAANLFPNFNPGRPDPVFDQIMIDRVSPEPPKKGRRK